MAMDLENVCKGFLSLIFLQLFVIFNSIDTVNAVIKCPQNCRCYWELDSLVLNCSKNALIVYPELDEIPVEKLDLSKNFFTEFPINYAYMEALTYLDLSNNQIRFLDTNTLVGFNNLRYLNLANNSITSWQSINPNDLLTPAINLQYLILNGNHLQTFTNEKVEQILISESLIALELAGCNITTVGGDMLMNGLPNLERINLSGNHISTITSIPSKSLRVLQISNSNLLRFSSHLLENLQAIEKLDLSWNGGLQFDNKNLLDSPTMNHLDLSFCNLDKMNLSALPNLTDLKLRGNMLRAIEENFFENNLLLENIDLARNSIRLIETNALTKLKRLTTLDLAYNEIARLDRNTFRTNDILISLNLSRNVIEKFTKFSSNSIREINLSWNEIITIDVNAFSTLTSIQRLDLSSNLIKDFPSGMKSGTLKNLDLSNCRLTNIKNSTFRDFAELASLHLNGNRLTNPLSSDYFRANKFLDEIWIGDNPWICDCINTRFIDFYIYLTTKPQKIKDKVNTRCASPAALYGRTWEVACEPFWKPENSRESKSEMVWTGIFLTFAFLVVLMCLFSCFQKWMKRRKESRNDREFRENQNELDELRRLNRRILDEEASPNAPTPFDTNLPSYEDAILMPKMERPAKSMIDLTASSRTRHSRRLRGVGGATEQTDAVDGNTEDNNNNYNNDGSLISYAHRFRSEEMLSNRDKERTAYIGPHVRRTGYIEYNSGSRRFSIEDNRFPPAHLKSQNLQSAEQIGNFQNYEYSPYTKRKPKIAEIPPFKRALISDSVEFLTDNEYETRSKPGSPFARRQPKSPRAEFKQEIYQNFPNVLIATNPNAKLNPPVEDYFGSGQKSKSNSLADNDFQLITNPEYSSFSSSASSFENPHTEKQQQQQKETNLKTKISSTDAATNPDEPIVIVHKPVQETLF